MIDTELDHGRLKSELINHLRNNPKTQFMSIVNGIERKIERKLKSEEAQLLLEIIQEFIVSNMLMTAIDTSNAGWPWFSLTRHGSEVLSCEGPPVYDYEGYLRNLRERVSSLDSIVEKYFSESLRAYQRNLFYASMVMLGCASERSIILLFESYIAAIDNEENQNKLKNRISKRDISTAYKEFRKSFDSTRTHISSPELPREFDTHIDGVFTFIRLLRNSIVHPTAIPNITSTLAYSNLQQFSYYIEAVFNLIEYYKNNPITV